MRGRTMVATLQWLGIVPSFSRPHVCNDNPYSEALFRTLKHTPVYPRLPFADLEATRRWVAERDRPESRPVARRGRTGSEPLCESSTPRKSRQIGSSSTKMGPEFEERLFTDTACRQTISRSGGRTLCEPPGAAAV
jgi:hypothetical protein